MLHLDRKVSLSARLARRRWRDFRGVLPEDGLEVCQSGPRAAKSLSPEKCPFSYIDGLFGLGLLGDWVDLSPTKYRRHLP